MYSRITKNFPAIILFLFFASLYIYTAAPGVYDGDSGEIAAAVNQLGLAHPTGFPLYMLFGKFVSLAGGSNIARTLNFLSSFLMATSVVLLFLVLRNFDIRPVPAFLSVMAFGFGKSIWYHAGIVAVYPLSVFFIILLLLIFSKWRKDQNVKYVFWYVFIWGLSFGTHLLMVTLFAPLATMIWENRARFCKTKPALITVALFIIPFIQYIYLPVAYTKNALVNFGSIGSLKDFWQYITQRDYAFKIWVRGQSDIYPFLESAISALIKEHELWFFLVSIVGLIVLFKKEHKIFAVLTTILLTNFIMIFSYGPKGDFTFLNRYLYPTYIVMAISVAWGVNWLINKLASQHKILIFELLLLTGLVFTFKFHLPYNNLRHNFIVSDYSSNILQTIDKGSILIVEGDAITGPIWYFQSIGQRDNVVVVDANLITLDWYVENMNKRYPKIIDSKIAGIRGLDRGDHRDKRLLYLINKNLPSRNIYLAIELSQNFIKSEKFDLFPIGVVYQVFPKGRLVIQQALDESSNQWNGYTMRNVVKNENYSFQVNAMIKYYAIILNNLGAFYFNDHQPQQALNYFEKAVSIYPSYVSAQNNLDGTKKYLNK